MSLISRPSLTPSRLLTVVALVAATIAVVTLPAQASTAQPWGTQGATLTDSAVTVRWDNDGNTPLTTVPRDASQVLPLTGGKTYADVDPDINTKTREYFSNLTMTVGQTRDLRNQRVTVTIGGIPSVTKSTPAQGGLRYVELFQCWGAPGADGKPDPDATSPDPRTCLEGPGGADTRSDDSPPARSLAGDPLAAGGDVAQSRLLPLLGVDGKLTSGFDYETIVNRTTTNELSRITSPFGGDASRAFELYTGPESSFLGCGVRPDAPSTGRCWLVAVPMSQKVSSDHGLGEGSQNPSGLTPSLWAQRLQVPLDFLPASSVCAGDQGRLLASGSELASLAMSSWVPGLCATHDIATGYSQLSDDQARRAQATGSAPFIVTTAQGRAPATYAPLALAGVVIGYTIDYRPGICASETWPACGYADRAEYDREQAKAGQPITGLKLNARLVAKLLTQSYGVESGGGVPHDTHADLASAVPWLTVGGNSGLFGDPEFRALNPQLRHHVTAGENVFQLEVETLRSDAAAAVWQWLLSDTAARGFLDGCPDPSGRTINPWYSTRTYNECPAQAATLEAAAKQLRDATNVPKTFDRGSAPDYTTLSAAYPQVLYAETGEWSDGSGPVIPATMVDLFPQLADQATAARNAARGALARGQWCSSGPGGSCIVSQWKPLLTAARISERHVAVITDTANAARFQLPTALLCDDGGGSCVGADADGIRAQAVRYAVPGADAVATPPQEPDYVGGAYPLTVLASAAVAPAGLTGATATSIAAALNYMTTEGQTEGTGAGRLPAGYVSLTPNLAAQAGAAILTLRTYAATHGTTTNPAPAASAPAAVAPAAPRPAANSAPAAAGSNAAAPAAGAGSAANPAGGTVTENAVAAAARTPATPVGTAGWAVPGGAGGAAVAAGAAAFLLRRRKAL